jgi:hypothetical protein
MTIETRAAAVSTCHPSPRDATRLLTATVRGATCRLPPRNTNAVSKSFQFHTNSKIANDARAGRDTGKTM